MRPNLVRSCVCNLCVLRVFVGCSLCLEICGILYWLLLSAHNKWYQSFQVALGISEDSKGSRSDSVEIVCRSQIRGNGVRGDRVSISEGRKEGSLNLC